jgi:hypothetical protein
VPVTKADRALIVQLLDGESPDELRELQDELSAYVTLRDTLGP